MTIQRLFFFIFTVFYLILEVIEELEVSQDKKNVLLL